MTVFIVGTRHCEVAGAPLLQVESGPSMKTSKSSRVKLARLKN